LNTRIDALADDVGRLRRRIEPGSSLEHLADRLVGHVETLHLIVTPSAGELVMWTAPGDEEAIGEAIRIVDERWKRLQERLR
jgi:hypothetical protein